MKQKGAGSQCVRRTNIGSLSFRERYLSLRQKQLKGNQSDSLFSYSAGFISIFHIMPIMINKSM